MTDDAIRKIIKEELNSLLIDILDTIDDNARRVNAYDSELPMIIIEALKTIQKRYENDN